MYNKHIDELKRQVAYLLTAEAVEALGQFDRWEALEEAEDELEALFARGYYGTAEAVYIAWEVR